MRTLRLLLVNQFYPPDMAPTGQNLHDLARALVARGHEVQVLCSSRSYDGGGRYPAEEALDDVRVQRVSSFGFGRRGAGRAADYLSFHLATAAHAVRSPARYDITLCLTTPPYVGWLLPRALGHKAGVRAHWVMDLYPDVLAAHGAVRPGGLVDRVLRRLTRRELRGSSLVLTLGSRMEEKVRAHADDRTRCECVPLWAPFLDADPDAEAVAAWRRRRGWGPGDLVLLYSGNMGLGHRLDEFLAAASEIADPSGRRAYGGPQGDKGEGVHGPRGDKGEGAHGPQGDKGEGARGPQGDETRTVWAFAGGGRRRGEVERFVADRPKARVQLLPYVSQEDLAASLAAADVHLVSLRTPWQGLIVPSKLQAAFGLGRPVIFVGPRDCEPADWLAASGGGWYVAEGDVDGLKRAVAAASDPVERQRRGEAGRAFARVHFDRATNTGRIADLLEEAVRASRSKDPARTTARELQ